MSGANSGLTATVAEGALQLTGSYAVAQFDVDAGATLFGDGLVDGDLNVQGRLAPGNSPGTMVVNGDTTLGGAFDVEIDGSVYDAAGGIGTYDRLVVTGATSVVTLGGTITPVLRGITAPATNTFTPVVGDVFRVIEVTENPNGISSTFDSLAATPTGLAPGTRFSVVYGTDFVDLALIPGDFGTFAATYDYDNLTNAAEAFESTFTSQVSATEFLNGLNGLSDDALALTILQASGEIHAFSMAGLRQAAGAMSVAALGRISSIPEGQQVWTDLSGMRMDYDDTGFPSRYENSQRHAWVGLDLMQSDDMRAGLALGYFAGDIDAGVSGDADYEGVSAAAYYHRGVGNLHLSTIAGFGFANIDTDRTVGLSTGTTTNTSERGAKLAFAQAKLEYDQQLLPTLKGTVWSSLQFDAVRTNSFVEDGDQVTALSVRSETETATTISAGYDLTGAVRMNAHEGLWRVGAGASYTPDSSRSASREVGLNGADWKVGSPEFDSVLAFISAGLHMPLSETASLDLSARAAKGNNWESYGVSLNLSTRW